MTRLVGTATSGADGGHGVFVSERSLRDLQGLLADRHGLTDDGSDMAGPTAVLPAAGSGYSYALLDLLLDGIGRIRLIEANVSNAAGTSSHGADLPRVRHEAETLLARRGGLARDAVLLRPFSPDTRSTPEIQQRAVLLASEMRARTGQEVRVISAARPLPGGPVVVCDDIPTLARDMTVSGDGTVLFRGRTVVFTNNPNVFLQYARQSGRDVEELMSGLDPLVLHEGSLMARIGLSKTWQQELAAGTSLTPVGWEQAQGLADAVDRAIAMAGRHGAAIVKPEGASGGVGVYPVLAGASRAAVTADLEEAASKLQAKYGPGWERTCPFVVYEFVESAPIALADGDRRWDMRFEVAAFPDRVEVTPLSARLCPEPIGSTLTRGNSVCNQTGRTRNDDLVQTPLQVMAALGLPRQRLTDMASAAHQWLRNALAGTPRSASLR